MSDETEEIPVVEEESSIEESPPKPVKKEKDPKRVKQGHKLAAIGQKAKEEKMRKKVKEEMIKPSTWVLMGVVLTSIGFVGFYFSPLFKEKEKIVYEKKDDSPKTYKNTNYFG